jgi:hypothetical protein
MPHAFDRSVRAVGPRISTALLLLCAGAALPAAADIITIKEMQQGITITQQQCKQLKQSVWVKAYDQDFCVRYYLSTAGGEGRKPLVFLQGDKLGPLDRKGTFDKIPSDQKDVDTRNLDKVADGLSKQAKGPGIYLARIGVDGTSGHHRSRKTALELSMVDEALNAIKKKHGLEGFHLVGQSGGATLVGGLISRRQDIGCAVPGSGRLARLKDTKRLNDPGKQYFDPAQSIPAIIRNGARILVVTDPADERVNVEHQITFVRNVRKAGGQIEQFFAQAVDKLHHGVSTYARYVAGGCIAGKSNQEIAQGLAELVKKRVASETGHNNSNRSDGSASLQSNDIWALPIDQLTNATEPVGRGR